MRKAYSALALTAAALATSACGLARGPKTPDEFAVARNAPLIIPPDFTLAPPVAGTGGLTPADAQQQAIDTLFGSPAPRSPGETSLLDAAGRDSAQTGIRSQVGDPNTRLVDKGPTTVQILTAGNTQSNVASAQPGQ
jgi:hypothetical protein